MCPLLPFSFERQGILAAVGSICAGKFNGGDLTKSTLDYPLW